MKTIFAAILALSIAAGAFAAESAAPARGSNNPDQVIDQILTVSGMKKSLQHLPVQFAASFMQAAVSSGANADDGKDLMEALEKAFPGDVFLNRVSDALKQNYDEPRYANVLQLWSLPLAKKMVELEAHEPKPADVQAFLAQVAKTPLPPARIKLIQRMDAATQSATLLTTLTISSLEAGALAAADDCAIVVARIKKVIQKSRPQIEKSNRSRAQVMLALVYRDVSDADLEAYVKTYEDKDSRWVLDIARTAIAEQFKASMQTSTQGMKKIFQAHRRKKTMFAPKCGQSASPHEDEARQGREEPEVEQEVEEKPVSKAPAPRAAPSANKTAPAEKPASAKPATAEKPAIAPQSGGQPAKKAAPSDNKVAALDKPARKAHRYPAPERDLRHCLGLATSAEIIACANK